MSLPRATTLDLALSATERAESAVGAILRIAELRALRAAGEFEARQADFSPLTHQFEPPTPSRPRAAASKKSKYIDNPNGNGNPNATLTQPPDPSPASSPRLRESGVNNNPENPHDIAALLNTTVQSLWRVSAVRKTLALLAGFVPPAPARRPLPAPDPLQPVNPVADPSFAPNPDPDPDPEALLRRAARAEAEAIRKFYYIHPAFKFYADGSPLGPVELVLRAQDGAASRDWDDASFEQVAARLAAREDQLRAAAQDDFLAAHAAEALVQDAHAPDDPLWDQAYLPGYRWYLADPALAARRHALRAINVYGISAPPAITMPGAAPSLGVDASAVGNAGSPPASPREANCHWNFDPFVAASAEPPQPRVVDLSTLQSSQFSRENTCPPCDEAGLRELQSQLKADLDSAIAMTRDALAAAPLDPRAHALLLGDLCLAPASSGASPEPQGVNANRIDDSAAAAANPNPTQAGDNNPNDNSAPRRSKPGRLNPVPSPINSNANSNPRPPKPDPRCPILAACPTIPALSSREHKLRAIRERQAALYQPTPAPPSPPDDEPAPTPAPATSPPASPSPPTPPSGLKPPNSELKPQNSGLKTKAPPGFT